MSAIYTPPETDPTVATHNAAVGSHASLVAGVAAAQAAVTALGASVAAYDLLLQDGTHAPQIPWGATSAPALSVGRVYYQRFVLPSAMTLRSITFGLQTADTADNAVHVGVYSGAGVRLVTSGPVTGKLNAAASSAPKVTVPDTALLANTVYYAAFLAPVIANGATSVLFATPGNVGLAGAYGATMPNVFVLWENSQVELSAVATPVAATSTNAGPLLIVRSAA